jgi:PAS domain S-box-containing protein/diguanylate cyclase (GGDEF)-like protein
MAQSLRIILVEKSTEDARLIMDTVHQGGLSAEFQHLSGIEGFKQLLGEGSWDLVIGAFYPEEDSALRLIEKVRQSGLDIPIIIVAHSVGEDLAVTLMHAGAHDFITKQNLVRLVPAIERELEELEHHRQHRASELALRESELRFRELTENIGEVFWLLDAEQQHMLYLSPAFEEMWERPSNWLLAQPEIILETIHPDDFDRVQALLADKGWLGFTEEYRILLPDGQTRWINTRSFPIRDESGSVYRIAGLSIDVSRSRQLEDEREMMSRALEQSADTVVITDEQGEIVYVNAAFEEITGYRKDEVIGKNTNILKSGLQEEKFYHSLWKSITGGLPFTDIFINRRKDGELYFEAKTVSPVYSNKGDLTHFVSTGKDITSRLKAKERLERLLHYDAVTGLANRVLLQDRLNQAILQARRHGSMLGVVCVSLELTELLGEVRKRLQGERLLKKVAQRLIAALDLNTTVARFSADEFVILLKHLDKQGDFEEVAKALVMAFSDPVVAEGYELFLSPAIGITLYPDDGAEGEVLIEHANLAMKHARHYGQSSYQFYNKSMLSKQKSFSS